MSQCSYVNVRIVSEKIAEWLESFLEEIEEANDGWCDVDVSIDGTTVTIDSGDCDAVFVGAPEQLSDLMDMLFELLRLEIDENADELCDSIEQISWRAETTGMDGDDGSYDRSNYEPDALQEMLEEIADCNDCSPEEVTDEMFFEFVQIEPDTVTELAIFEYDRSSSKSTYYYTNRMSIRQKETDEAAEKQNPTLDVTARIIKKVVDQLSEEDYCKVKLDAEEETRKSDFASRDEFSAALAKAFNRQVPYFYDNYCFFANYIKEKIDGSVITLSETELGQALRSGIV